jgi:aflatoxin B1 aldehyde reductase
VDPVEGVDETIHRRHSAPIIITAFFYSVFLSYFLLNLPVITIDSFKSVNIQLKSIKMSLVAQNVKPRVILGLMTFGPTPEKGARITSLDEFNQQLDYLQSEGFNEVDTARSYVDGEQEGWTRQARWKERGLKLATKCYPHVPGQHKPENLRQSLETSLKELGSDQVDIFYLHAADRSVPFAETMEEVNKLYKEGKFVQLGLSNYTAFEVAEIVTLCAERGWVRPTIFQAMYNAISEYP